MKPEEFDRCFAGPPTLGGPFTVDSPIRYDAWRAYALAGGGPVDLLLELDLTLDQVATLRAAIEAHGAPSDHLLSGGFGLGVVAMKIPFETFFQVLVPLTDWRQLLSVGKTLERSELAEQLTYVQALEHSTASDTAELPADPMLPQDMPPEIRKDLTSRFRWFILLAVRIGYLDGRKGAERLDDFDATARGGAVRWLSEQFAAATLVKIPRPESITENRKATVAIRTSSSTVKSDAARRVFEIDASAVGWAVLDTGIDANHPAFVKRSADGKPVGRPFSEETTRRGHTRIVNNTRVRATYNLIQSRAYLSSLGPSEAESGLHGTITPGGQVPVNDHGTHVAGILAGNWPEQGLVGICPDLQLYDMRVLDDDGTGDEVDIIAALRLVRLINEEAGRLVIHGVNLSLSIRHRVRNFACGWTPVCRAAQDLVDSGVVVVAAAGNTGFSEADDRFESLGAGFNLVSITDPGNAEKVITVGGTDRIEPYTYGTSYFSARGPTADGRLKPDLLAPSQSIAAPVPGGAEQTYDGTSQAAPHVSGVAALLLARYPELRGNPARVKAILCDTASDLGRDRYFQGHGLVDALRALQSI